MKHRYQISGLSCQGCSNHVTEALLTIKEVEGVHVDLEKGWVEIILNTPIDIPRLNVPLKGSQYALHSMEHSVPKINDNQKNDLQQFGTFYCPMRCEGDKTYSKAGDCPVCGMDLVPIQVNVEEEYTNYSNLLKKLIVATLFTVPIFLIAMLEMFELNAIEQFLPKVYSNWIQFTLSLPVVFYATWMFFTRAWTSIVRRSLNMFTLIGIGAGAAWGVSVVGLLFPSLFPDQFKGDSGSVHLYFEAATVILTLVLLGQVLETKAHIRTNSAVKELLKLTPRTTIVVDASGDREISIDEINVADKLRIKPGAKIPVDGRIIEGIGSINESMISGEPIPVDKTLGDSVRAGTINGTGSFIMEAEKVGEDTLLSQIVRMVNEASRSQAPIQRLADKISTYFVPIVICVAIITFFVWFFIGPEPQLTYGFINAVAVLVIACPCALGLATPMSIMVGVGKGAQSGVLVKDAESLELLNKVTVLILDKTGTITKGRPSVEKVIGSSEYSDESLIEIAASINKRSEHPLAQAIVAHAEGNSSLKVGRFESITGKGVKGVIDGCTVLIGNFRLLEDHKVEIDASIFNKAEEEQAKGKTVPFIAMNNKLVGCIVIYDAIKPSSKTAISTLQNKGVRVVMMTGDNEFTAEAVAQEVEVDGHFSDCLPEDKLNYVKELQRNDEIVAMVGDGINDAPALALSDIGIAMGTGTDVAIESSEITLVQGDLLGIVQARSLSEKVLKNIKQNLVFALGYNVLGVPIAAGVLYPFFGILLSPMIAALAMSFSSVSVIANALRLRTKSI